MNDKVELISAEGSLPIHVVCSSSVKRTFLSLMASTILFMFAFITDALVPSSLFGEQKDLLADSLSLIAAALAALFLLRGLLGFVARQDITVDDQAVSVSASFRFWVRRWQEPLTNYRGVRWNRYAIHEDRSRGSSQGIKTRYRHVIDLVHDTNAKRTVPLFVAETGRAKVIDTLTLVRKAFSAPAAGTTERAELEAKARGLGEEANAGNPRARWEALSALLGLPAIDARDGANEIRDAGDLDKSIKDLAAEGRINADWSGSQPPRSLEVEQRGDPEVPSTQELRITIHAAHLPKAILYSLGGIGAVLGITGVLRLDFGAVLGGLLFGGAAYGIWYLQRKNPHQLTVTRNEIRYEDPLVPSRSFVMPLQEIESIKIRDRDSESAEAGNRTLKFSGKELLISSDKRECGAGGGLAEDELQWLRDYLLAAVAKA